MNKRFLSTLLFGALFIASTSVFVSCKDYDDDIQNLQTQIDKAALKSELTALQSQLNDASTNATAAMKNLEEKLAKQAAEQNASNADLQKQIDAVKAAADAAAKDLAAKIEAAAKAAADAQAAADKAQQSADQAAKDAAEVAKAAKEAAEQLVAEAVKNLNEQNAALAKQLEQLGNQMKEYVTATELNKQIEELKNQIAHMDGASEVTAAYRAAVDELYKAVTSVELIDSFTGWDFASPLGGWSYSQARWGLEYPDYYGLTGNMHFTLTHGFVPEDAVFGDNELNYIDIDGKPENAFPQVVYKKGDDVKDPTYGLIVRVNPVNADITTSQIKLMNSLGEDLSDYVKIGTPERYHTLYTRARTVENGLWILPFEIAKGVSEEAFLKKTTVGGYLVDDPAVNGTEIVYAVAINNTAESDPSRYVVSSYDVSFEYTTYVPANHFTFNVNNREGARSVNNIKNRYLGAAWDPCIYGETGSFYNSNYELEWADVLNEPTAVPIYSGAKQNVQNNVNYWDGYGCTMWDNRFWEDLLVVGVGETFSISDIAAYTAYGSQVAIDSIYVVLDKHNAVESAPSEINAWESYKIDGLNQVVPATRGIELTINDKRADRDVIGFRVFAVNRDGSLVDPDGRSFYVYVADEAPDQSLSATVTATVEGNTDTSTEMNTDKKWNNLYKYVLTIDPANNPKVVVGGAAQDADLSFFQFNWNGGVSGIYGGISADLGTGYLKNNFKKLTITPQNIENLLDGATYTFKLTGYEVVSGTYPAVEIPRTVTLITLTKLMPNKAKDLTFRPKQETTDGSGDVIAYMIPNKQGTVANAYAPFADFNFAPHFAVADMEACYDARDAKASNGFKNLTNIFYNLSKNGQNGFDADPLVYDENEWDKTFEFVFATSDKDGKKDLVDGSGKGVAYEHPQGNETWQKYMLEVPTKLIDGTTKHDVKTSTVYKGISTKLKADGSVDCYNKDYPVANGQNFTFTYACWHHANTFAWKAASAMPKLKWTHEGVTKTSPFTDIVSANTYDPAFFGDGKTTATSKTLNDLAIKNFLIGTDNVQLNTQADGKGQKNPYYVPSIAGTTITYKQASTQTDAAPVADHTEYLIITMKDAFNHDVKIVLEVLIQRP
jgi:regulator of replication initiation timing